MGIAFKRTKANVRSGASVLSTTTIKVAGWSFIKAIVMRYKDDLDVVRVFVNDTQVVHGLDALTFWQKSFEHDFKGVPQVCVKDRLRRERLASMMPNRVQQ